MFELDRDFVVHAWLESYKRSPPSMAMGAHRRDVEIQRRYWAGHERIVHKLLDHCQTTVAEAIGDNGVPVIVGFMCAEPDENIIHYVLTRRGFQRMGVATDLMLPFAGRDGVLYSHMTTDREIRAPMGWAYDPYCAIRFFT